MKLAKSAATLAVLGSLLTSTVASAGVTRSAAALPSRPHMAQAGQMAVPASKRMDEQSNLLGAPLFIAFLGAVAITIGTIVIVNNNNDSPG